MQRFGTLAADITGVDDHRPPIVLLHGLTFDRTMWCPTLEALAVMDPQRRIVAFDLPGHGESDPQERYDIGSLVAAVRQAIEEAAVDAPVVVGHSIGAVIATAYAAQHPTRGVVNVDQPLFVAPFAELVRTLEPRLRGPDFDAVWQQFADGFHTEVLAPEARELVHASSRPDQDVVLGYWHDVLETPTDTLTATVDRLLEPLAANGLRYTVVTGSPLDQRYATWLHTRLPHARVVVWPDSGHFPHLAHPTAFASLLADTARW